jgi:phosphate transport system substrate-binding protein
MKYSYFFILASLFFAWASQAGLPPKQLKGSETLSEVMIDAIHAAGLPNELAYLGGGSTLGENALLQGFQDLVPLSREVRPEALQFAQQMGFELLPYPIALDGITILVNSDNKLEGLDLATLRKIYTCEIKLWEEISKGEKKGSIHALRRDDKSGTSDLFKTVVGVQEFGDCVAVLSPQDIASQTSSDPLSIGYGSLSDLRDKNRKVGISRSAEESPIFPNLETIRNFSYPLARKLYIYTVGGNRTPAILEQKLMKVLTDRNQMDKIVESHGFYTLK